MVDDHHVHGTLGGLEASLGIGLRVAALDYGDVESGERLREILAGKSRRGHRGCREKTNVITDKVPAELGLGRAPRPCLPARPLLSQARSFRLGFRSEGRQRDNNSARVYCGFVFGPTTRRPRSMVRSTLDPARRLIASKIFFGTDSTTDPPRLRRVTLDIVCSPGFSYGQV